MTKKFEIVAIFAFCCVLMAPMGTGAESVARADDPGTALYNGINGLRQPCGPLTDDPRLRAAAQRHADDLLRTGLSGHIGSDGSSPRTRIADAGYTRAPATGEIISWGTGSAATPTQALDSWMQSPPHRGIIVNCAFTASGFATASDGNKMTAVGDFAAP
ncbi:CAP domain-containing protein [Mycobacterium paraffinicum]|uniref:SCP domain-containing protein n=1 Tax=Mycobacterium paraffinicum TaxID=53378 RepID=A0ABP8F4N5_9MYCO|nr:CAP domain-containing protein [Mycobacterium paraffinicum]MCV7311030.1 CAP domain-containing protein [Mycobacterium paraffinicum]